MLQADHDNRIPLSRIQRLIGSLMHRAKREGAFFYLECMADLTELTEMRKAYSRSVGVRVTTNDFFFRAMALAAADYPRMAAQVIDGDPDHLQISPTIGVGFAVAAPQGLVVPVIQDIQNKALPQIARESDALLIKARSNKLTLDDFSGANVVLTGLGMYGAHSFYAIAQPGTSGILSIGNINDTIVPTGDGFVVRKHMSVCLAADYRVVDEFCAAGFLSKMVGHLEHPRFLMDVEA